MNIVIVKLTSSNNSPSTCHKDVITGVGEAHSVGEASTHDLCRSTTDGIFAGNAPDHNTAIILASQGYQIFVIGGECQGLYIVVVQSQLAVHRPTVEIPDDDVSLKE